MFEPTATSANLNGNQFKKTLAAGALGGPVGVGLAAGAYAAPKIAKGVKAAAPIAAKAAGNVAKAGAKGIRAAAPTVARAAGGAALANPVGAGLAATGAAAYGASKTPGGSSIIKGAVQGAKGPNKGIAGPVGAVAGAVKGAATSQGAKNVVSGAGKGALIGALGGPIGAAVGAGVGLIGGLFSHRGMGGKPKGAAGPQGPVGGSVPNRATPYVVKKGDTLTSIAAANKTTVAALRKANPKFMEAGSKYNKGNMIWSGTKVNLK